MCGQSWLVSSSTRCNNKRMRRRRTLRTTRSIRRTLMIIPIRAMHTTLRSPRWVYGGRATPSTSMPIMLSHLSRKWTPCTRASATMSWSSYLEHSKAMNKIGWSQQISTAWSSSSALISSKKKVIATLSMISAYSSPTTSKSCSCAPMRTVIMLMTVLCGSTSPIAWSNSRRKRARFPHSTKTKSQRQSKIFYRQMLTFQSGSSARRLCSGCIWVEAHSEWWKS